MTTKDATQQGVPAESDNTEATAAENQAAEAAEIEYANTKRVSTLDAIAERTETAMLEENGIEQAEPETPEPTGTETPEPAAAAPEAAAPDAPVEIDPNTKVKIKVDGEEKVVTWAEAQKDIQLEQAARRRMEEASRRQKELDAREAALAAREAQQQPPKQNDQGKRDQIRTALETLYEGEPEKAAEILAELFETGRQSATPDQQYDPDQVADIAAARIEEKTALKQFAKEYKDIVSDPYLANIADQHLDAIRATEPTLSFEDALAKAGSKTRDWMKQAGLGATPATANPATPDPSRETKLQKKAGMDKVPTLSVVPGTTPEAPDENQDRMRAVQELRRARGQAG